MKLKCLLLCALLFCTFANFAEINQTFSNTLMFIVGHVSTDFKMLKGNKYAPYDVPGGERYVSKGKVQGAIWNDIVHDKAGWRYEGLLYDGEPAKLAEYYKEHENQLRGPMQNAGYTRTEQMNNLAAFADYPDLVFTYKDGSPVIKMIIKKSNRDGFCQLLVQVMK